MPGDEAVIDRFLDLYLRDLARGEERTLAEYQALFPGHEATISEQLRDFGSTRRDPPVERAGTPILAPGSRIGPYELRREVGRGSFGAVFVAEDSRLGREVALKILLHPAEALLSRFAREARVLARLAHPGICPIHETGRVGSCAYIAMPFVDGETLQEHIRRHRASRTRFEARAAAALIASIAHAVEAAHEQRIVHRDLKPGNVILGRDGRPVILDFGLAQAEALESTALSTPGEVIGTPLYMSPEQARGERVGPTSDVWSLGSILHELVTGEPPFTGATRAALLGAIATDPLLDPRRRVPDLPRDLAVIILTALDRDPARRYRSAGALAQDLDRFLASQPIAARPVGPLGRLRRWVRREPALAALLLVLLIALPAITALLLRLSADAALRAAERTRRAEEAREEALTTASLALFERGRGARAEIERLDPRDAEAALLRVILEMDARRYEEVLAILDGIGNPGLVPRSIQAFRADALRGLGRDEEAQALQADPGPPGGPTDSLFLARRLAQRRDRARTPEATTAMVLAEEAALASPKPRALALATLVSAAGLAGDATRARAAAQAMIRLWPDSAPMWFTAGWSQQLAGDSEAALEAYHRALLLRPDFYEARVNRGAILEALGRPAEALAEYDLALEHAREKGAIQASRALALEALGRTEEAIEAAQAAVAAAPREAVGYSRLVTAHVSAGRLEEALDACEAGMQATGEDPGLLRLLAALHTNLGRWDEAVESGRKALLRNPGNATVLNNLAIAYHYRGEAALAWDHWQDALRHEPRYGAVHLALGAAASERLDHARAIEHLRIACAELPQDPRPARRRVDTLLHAHRIAEALEAAQELAAAYPESAFAWTCLGRALLDSGRFAEAVAVLERAEALPYEAAADPARWRRRAANASAWAARVPAAAAGLEPLPEQAEDAVLLAIAAAHAGSWDLALRCLDLVGSPGAARALRENAAVALGLCAAQARGAEGPALRQRLLEHLAGLAADVEGALDRDPEDASRVDRSLSLLENRPEFAAFREAASLEQLPRSEARAWRALWDRVASLRTELQDAVRPDGP